MIKLRMQQCIAKMPTDEQSVGINFLSNNTIIISPIIKKPPQLKYPPDYAF